MGTPLQLEVQGATPRGETGPATVEGVLDRVLFRSSGSDFLVARLTVAGRPLPCTIRGALPGVREGERIRVQGRWVEDPRYGPQIAVSSFLPVEPDTLVALERFLSNRGAGVGQVMAKRLIEHFGTSTLDVLDHHPERLTEVPGIGRGRAERIVRDWSEHKETRDALIFLQGLELPPGLATRIQRQYGRDTVTVVRTDPFRLCGDVRGVGFLTADRVAARVGIAKDSAERLCAGLRHTLDTAREDGHCFLPETDLLDRAEALLQAPRAALREALSTLVERGALVAEMGSLPDGGRAIWLVDLHRAESTVAHRLRTLLHHPGPGFSGSVPAALAAAQERAGFVLSDTQRQALAWIVERKVLVLTGGPGTGKTTLLRAGLDLLERAELRVKVAAPTGRAARRLEETTGRKASTLHKLLEWDPEAGRFTRGMDRPLTLDALVIDECSMVDVSLLSQCLLATPDSARLVLVGDADQLPSVGPGRVLADVIGSGAVPVIRLDTVFRQDQKGLINANAHELLRGRIPRSSPMRDGDFFVILREDPEAAAATVVQVVSERMPAAFGIDPRRDVQVLCPMRKGPCGAEALNDRLRRALNPALAAVPVGEEAPPFAPGDRVMQIRNDYDKDLSNGDIGLVQSVESGGRLVVRFDSGTVAEYPRDERGDLDLAWATTIHKSQGSEYPAVVIPLMNHHWRMLQRNLLYTAITRGRRLVVLVVQQRALEQAAGAGQVEPRYTSLSKRMRLELLPGSLPPG